MGWLIEFKKKKKKLKTYVLGKDMNQDRERGYG